jgi:hypothetical protein
MKQDIVETNTIVVLDKVNFIVKIVGNIKSNIEIMF